MSKHETQHYHRELALSALHRFSEPVLAGDVAERMASLAMEDGHPKAYWAHIDTQSAAGALRALEGAGKVERCAGTRNARSGRNDPTWRVIGKINKTYPVAAPPEANRAKAEPKEESPYGDMTRPQLYTLLAVHDTYASFFADKLRHFANFTDELQRLAADARRELARVGLEPKE